MFPFRRSHAVIFSLRRALRPTRKTSAFSNERRRPDAELTRLRLSRWRFRLEAKRGNVSKSLREASGVTLTTDAEEGKTGGRKERAAELRVKFNAVKCFYDGVKRWWTTCRMSMRFIRG